LTRFEGRNIAPRSQSNGGVVHPPLHWLAMVQERAPHLLEPGGPLSTDSTELSTDPVSLDVSPFAPLVKPNSGFFRKSLFLLGQWLLRLGHILTDGQYVRSRPYPCGNNSKPPDHWLAMIQSQNPSPLNLGNSFEISKRVFQRPDLQLDGPRYGILQPSHNLVNRVSSDVGNLSNSSDGVGLSKISVVSPKQLNMANFGWPLVKLCKRLSSLTLTFTAKQHVLVSADGLKSGNAGEDSMRSASKVEFRDNVTRLGQVKNFGSRADGIDAKGLLGSTGRVRSLSLSKLLTGFIKRLGTINFSWSPVKFGKWLLSLGRIFVPRWRTVGELGDIGKKYTPQRYPEQRFDKLESESNLGLDTYSQQTIGLDQKTGREVHTNLKKLLKSYNQADSNDSCELPKVYSVYSDPGKFNWSLARFGRWLFSLRHVAAGKHTVTLLKGGDYRQQHFEQLSDQIRFSDNAMASSGQEVSDVTSVPLSSRADNNQTGRPGSSCSLSDIKYSTSLSGPLAHWLALVRKKTPHFSVSRNISKNTESYPGAVGFISSDEAVSSSWCHSSASYNDVMREPNYPSPSKVADHNNDGIISNPPFADIGTNTDRAKRRYSGTSATIDPVSHTRQSVADVRANHTGEKISHSWPNESTFHSLSEIDEAQVTTWPALPDDPGPVEVDALERVKSKEPTEDYSWPEFLSSSVKNGFNSPPVTAKFSSLLITDGTSLAKVIDTTKERKQRELMGTLWNA
jgi:hypothetical protein